MTSDRAARLAGYIAEPTRERAILDFVERAERPLLLREIAEGVSMGKASITSALIRLCDKELLSRKKAPITYPGGRWGGTQTKMTWLYSAPSGERG